MNIKSNFLAVMVLAAAVPSRAAADDTLHLFQMIDKNLSTALVSKPMGYYALVMDPDGTLLIRRTDHSVRHVLGRGGDFAVMQGDGNFVMYRNPGQALWWTGTHTGYPNTVTLHDDGDLAVYSPGPNSRKLWNLGSDHIWPGPKRVGDVLGRDLAFNGAGYLGHLGIWDGKRIYEVGPPKSGNNAVHINDSVFDFKHVRTNAGTFASYWGTVSYKIPGGKISMTACFDISCPYLSRTEAEARYSIHERLLQIYRIGADYVATGVYRRARPRYGENSIPERGAYRCDTFVIDALEQTTFYIPPKNTEQQTWTDRWGTLRHGVITPKAVYDALKSYQ